MVNKKFNVVGIGRAYTDLVASVPVSFLSQHQIPCDGQRECTIAELTTMQAVLKQAQWHTGGSSANVAAIVTALGGTAGFFGKVARDAIGENFLKDLTARKITLCCEPYVDSETMSGLCLVLLTDAHRSFAYNAGCANHFSAADVKEFDFSETEFFLVEAHLLTHADAVAATQFAISSAKQKQTEVIINLHGIIHWEEHKAIAEYIANNADILIGNQAEQNAFKEKVIAETIVITTKGEMGVEATQGNQHWSFPAKKPKKLVSTAGAGDAFIGGLLFGLTHGKNLPESLNLGIHTASAILSEEGAKPNWITRTSRGTT